MSNETPAEETHDTQAAHVLSDKDVRQFLRKYYYIANELGLDTEYGDLFAEDGVFIMGTRKARGRDGKLDSSPPDLRITIKSPARQGLISFLQAIRALRRKLWEEVFLLKFELVYAMI